MRPLDDTTRPRTDEPPPGQDPAGPTGERAARLGAAPEGDVAGRDLPGQDAPEQRLAEQDRIDQAYADRGGADQAYADGGSADRAYADERGADQAYADERGADQGYAERGGADQAYVDGGGMDQGYADRGGADPGHPDSGDRAAAGQVPGPRTGEEPTTLIPHDRSADYHHRWETLKAQFVDEPRTAVRGADVLVGEVLDEIEALFRNQRGDLERDLHDDQASTEDLRLALGRYRSFFDRLLSF